MQRRFSLPSITAIAALAAALLVTVLMVPVLAGSNQSADATGNHSVPEFEYTTETSCDGELTYAVYAAGSFSGAEDVTPDVSEPDATSTLLTFRVPGLEGGEWTFERACDGEVLEYRDFFFSRVGLTKAVEGEVPAETTFTVNVACESNGESLFPPEDREFTGNGTDQVIFYQSGESVTCTITEPDDGGAENVFIEPPTLTYTQYSDGSSTVTNVFPAAEPTQEPEPPQEPEPEEPSPTPTVDDTVEEAEPAEPVEAEPDFTG